MTEKGKDLVLQCKLSTGLRFPNAAITALAAYFLLAYAVLQAPVFSDPDSAWHLAAGQEILQHRALPETDPWSFTAGGTRWYNLAWLYDIAVAGVYQLGGLTPLWWLVMAAAAGLTGLMAAMCFRAGAGFIATMLVAGLSGFILIGSVQLRPHWVSFYMAAAFYLVLERQRRLSTPRLHWVLPVLMALWVNCHGAFAAGFTILGAFWLEALHERRWRYASELAAAGAVCALAVFLNPYGPGIVTGMMRTLGSVMAEVVTEWGPVNIGRQTIIMLHLLLALTVLYAGAPRLRLADGLLALFWIVAGLASIRYYFFAAILAAPALAVCLRDRLEHSPLRAWYLAKDRDFTRDCNSPKGRRNGSVILAVMLAALAVPTTRQVLWPAPLAYATEKAPMALVEYLSEHHGGSRILNDYNMGGFLIYHVRDRIRPFIDGRAGTAYPEPLLKDYLDMVRYNPNAEALLDRYRINAVAMPSDNRLVQFLKTRPGWETGFDTQGFTVMVRPPIADGGGNPTR